jgi:hypothetical protein
MKKEVVTVEGEEVLVREDVAKKYRGVHWAIYSISAFVILSVLLFFYFFVWSVSDGSVGNPAQTANSANR